MDDPSRLKWSKFWYPHSQLHLTQVEPRLMAHHFFHGFAPWCSQGPKATAPGFSSSLAMPFRRSSLLFAIWAHIHFVVWNEGNFDCTAQTVTLQQPPFQQGSFMKLLDLKKNICTTQTININAWQNCLLFRNATRHFSDAEVSQRSDEQAINRNRWWVHWVDSSPEKMPVVGIEYMGVNPKIMIPPNHPFNRVWNHYFYHPFCFFSAIFGNTHIECNPINGFFQLFPKKL